MCDCVKVTTEDDLVSVGYVVHNIGEGLGEECFFFSDLVRCIDGANPCVRLFLIVLLEESGLDEKNSSLGASKCCVRDVFSNDVAGVDCNSTLFGIAMVVGDLAMWVDISLDCLSGIACFVVSQIVEMCLLDHADIGIVYHLSYDHFFI